MLVSEVVLVGAYGALRLATVVATVAAFIAGAVPNWILNRRWAWERHGRVDFRREMLPYGAIVALSLLLATVVTAATDRLASTLTESIALRSILVGAAYIAMTLIMFIVKFVLFDRLVFAERPGDAAP
jgi:putative flippase GtrA